MSVLKKSSQEKSLSLSQDNDLIFPKTSRIKKAQKFEDTQKILKYIDDNIIGKGNLFLGPFGRRKVCYADYSTSGRSLQFLEDYISKEVLPAFGDSNCSSAVTGLQTHLYDTESREIIKQAINASCDDEIIFCNNPSERLSQIFLLHGSNSLSRSSYKDHNLCDESECNNDNVILFVSQIEPLSNLKSWIDLGAQIERLERNHDGFLDLVDLEKKLRKYSETKCKLIGLFSSVSRLTGILNDDVATTILLHQYNAISLWDYTASCSSAQINLNPSLPGSLKDALFFNCNNMIGGVQASGVLVIKKSLIQNYPSIQTEMINSVNVVRCGLVMQLKETIGDHIMTRHEKICKQMLLHLRTIPEIIVVNPSSRITKRIPTIAFMIKHPRCKFLHHRFVVAILNDVFGIQSTANNLLHHALGVNDKLKFEYEKLVSEDIVSIHPGFTRITFPFFMSDAEIGYILEALKMVATEAWKLLPQYQVDSKTGEWKHLSNSLIKERKWLHSIRYNDGKMLFSNRRISQPNQFPQNFADCLQTARNLFNRARKTAQKSKADENLYPKITNEKAETLRWFMVPREAHELLLGHSQNVKNDVPFEPNTLIELPAHVNLIYHRTNSLSALDIKRAQNNRSFSDNSSFLTPSSPKCSSSSLSKHPLELSSSPLLLSNIKHSLGDAKCAMTNFSTSPHTRHEEFMHSRHRCYSWSSSKMIPIIENKSKRNPKRLFSQSSQTDLRLSSIDTLENRIQLMSDAEHDIQAYVKEVTKEISDEIKSEIREVISQVEDVLENSESSLDIHSLCGGASSSGGGDDSRVNEGFISPDFMKTKLIPKQRLSDISNDASSDKLFIDVKRQSLPGTGEKNLNIRPVYTGAISKLKCVEHNDVLSSCDSGINLSFQDDERKKTRNFFEEKFTFHENEEQFRSVSRQLLNDDAIMNDKRQLSFFRGSSNEIDEPVSWQNLPKEIWKQAAETTDEFNLIRDGDKILVCVSGSSSSFCLVHFIRQFARARGINVEMSVITVSDEHSLDPRSLMLYFQDLSVEFLYDCNIATTMSMHNKLLSVSRKKKFSIVALSTSLDKCASEFLTAIFVKGKLQTLLPSHQTEDVKIIRPFLFIRERLFEDFSILKNFPSRSSKIFTSMPNGMQSIMKVQEVLNSSVYENIKKIIHSLILQKNLN